MFLYNFGGDAMKRVKEEKFPCRLRRDVVIGLLRLYTSELLFYQDDPSNPHGAPGLNEACLLRLPVDGTLQDMKAETHGDAEDLSRDEDGLVSHFVVEGDDATDHVVPEEDLCAWLAGGYEAILGKGVEEAAVEGAVDLLVAEAATGAAATAYLRCLTRARDGGRESLEALFSTLGDHLRARAKVRAVEERLRFSRKRPAAGHGVAPAQEKGGEDKLQETLEKAREDAAQVEARAASFLDLAGRRVGDLVAKYGRAL